MAALAIFPHMKDPPDEYFAVRQLVAQFVICNQDTTNFARVELRQHPEQTRVTRSFARAARKHYRIGMRRDVELACVRVSYATGTCCRRPWNCG